MLEMVLYFRQLTNVFSGIRVAIWHKGNWGFYTVKRQRFDINQKREV